MRTVHLAQNILLDLLHLLENMFDRKRIYANPSSYPTLTLTLTLLLKRNNVFGLTKWRRFSIKCTDTAESSGGVLCLFVCFIFILLLRESDDGAILWTNPHPLRSCPFPSFPVVSLTSYHWICGLFEATKQR